MDDISALRNYIWLSQAIKYTSISRVLERFYNPEAVLVSTKEQLCEVLSREEAEEVLKRDFTKADEILEQCYLKEISIVTISDSLYPDMLRNIENPPIVLYYKGRLPDFDNKITINIIGTRKASAYGQIVAKKISYSLADSGVIIVSGMASGIDSIANQTAILANKPTIAVLGCSVDVCYPYENRRLMDDIIAVGAVISEFPPTTKAYPQNFRQRNRIMSGLSKGVLVIEAPERSGTLITANYALEQGRDIFAIPGNIDSFNSKGCNKLIKNGAKMVTCAWDILEEYSDESNHKDSIKNLKQPISVSVISSEETRKSNKIEQENVIEKPQKRQPITTNFKRTNMTEMESKIYDIIKDGSEFIDDIILKSGLKPALVMSTITMLEIYGDIYKIDKRIKIKEN